MRYFALFALAAGCAHAPPAPAKPCLAGPPPAQVQFELLQKPEPVTAVTSDGESHEALMLLVEDTAMAAYGRYIRELRAYAAGAWGYCREVRR